MNGESQDLAPPAGGACGRDRAEIDTSAPFESVREAVDHFGGSASWSSHFIKRMFAPQKMVDYNVLGGKCNRGISVVDSYKLLKGADVLGEEEMFLACTLDWCIEWLQAFFLVLDDIMADSHTRRGQHCWFRVPQVGLIAVNDGIILRNHISRILRLHFKGRPYYADLLDLFNEV